MSRIFRVKGPPGTGKTTYLARQAQVAAEKHGAHSVAIASLTRTAAAEIGGRDTPLPPGNIGTLHAHALRSLDSPELAETPASLKEFVSSNFRYADLASNGSFYPLDGDFLHTGDGENYAASPVHAAVKNHRARRTPPELWSAEEREFSAVWEAFKRETDRLDYTDLIEHCVTGDVAHHAAPRVLLLDEAQDFSALELALVQTWAQHTETTVIVGDSQQALYGWRGSDAGILDDLPVAGDRLLDQSYRVPRAVHAAAQAWVSQLPGGAVDWHPTDEPGRVDQAGWSLRNTDELVEAVSGDAGEGRTVMVLAACHYHLGATVNALRRAGVPFHNPYRTKDGAWNPMRAAGRLTAYLRPQPAVWGERARVWTWDDVRLWTDELVASESLARGAKKAIAEMCRPDQFGESRADDQVNLETLATLLGSEDHPALSMDVDWWERHLKPKAAKAIEYPLAILRRQGARALTETPKVIVGTCHSVKGGEADSVYLAPDLSRAGYWGDGGWHDGGPGRAGIVRMFYVGLTRARERVTVLQPSGPEHVDPLALTDVTWGRVAA